MKKLPIFLALYTILIGLSAFFLTNLHQPNIPQAQAATSASGTITISNSGSTQTDYDVLVVVDTATIISAGNMQSDCDDIRLYDSDDSTALDYWIESGCNTATTQLWVTVPSIPNGDKDIYLHYNDGAMANGEQSSGNFILMYNNTCPSGWTRNTSFDSRFPYGASSYSGTAGAATHTHSDKAITSGGGSGYGCTDGPGRPSSGHTHNLTISANSVSALPPYLNMVYCQKSDLDINTGLIAIFDATAPSGWTRFTALDSKFPYGASSYGSTGGASTHTHTITHSGVSGYSHLSGCTGTKTYPVVPSSHTHSWSNTTSGSTSNLPAYLNVIFGSIDSTGVGSPDMISMFTALPPLGWTRLTALDSKYIQGSSSYGGTGGTSGSHTHTTSGTSGTYSGSTLWCQSGSHGSCNNTSHNHAYNNSTNGTTNTPPRINTIFGKRNDPVGDGVTTSITFGPPAPTAPTIGTATVVSDTSIQWNFTDNASDEDGFKVYDTSNVLKATCSTANLTSCTETGLTANTAYTRKVVAYNTGGDSSYSSTDTATTNKTSCQPAVNDTAHTITGDCSFSDSRGTDATGKTIYGMDPGTGSSNTAALTVESGTLTITSTEHVAVGTISMTGGSIAITNGGKITPGGVIYYPDSDSDGYPSSTTPQVSATTPSGKRRRNVMTSTAATDCNDSSNSVYQNLTGYLDSDGDGYGTGSSSQICSGASLIAGYAANATDCDDNAYSSENSCQSNYFGDGSDGAVTISSNTNISCTTDGDMAVKEYSSLTINSGRTLTTNNRCKGLFIYVSGNATINGTLSMTARGASVSTSGVSSTGLRLPMYKSGSTQTLAAADFAGAGSAVISAVSNQSGISSNGKIYTLSRTGNSGGNGGDASSSPNYSGYPGGTGDTKTGGGGGGAAGGGAGTTNVTRGGAGTCFSGGSGGGAQYHNVGYQNYSTSVGGSNGGAGGNGSLQGVYYGGSYSAGGGAGNNGGNDYDGVHWAANASPGGNGTGGLLYLVVGGNLTITGLISADGVAGGANGYYGGGGGGSGGGNVIVLYAGSLSNSGTVRASGGAAGAAGSHGRPGGAGGNGQAILEQVDY